MMQTKFPCHPIVQKSIDNSYRTNVEITIKYPILESFHIFNEAYHVHNFISIIGLKFKKDHFCNSNSDQ